MCRNCWLRTKLWDALWVWKSTFWSHTWTFSQKILAKSVTNTVKDFNKTLWLWKSGTKASGPQVCWQTIAGEWRWKYLTPNTGESHTPLHFRGKFLSHEHVKYYFAHLNSSVSLKPCPIEIFCIYISEFSIQSTAKFIYWRKWDKKNKFCLPVLSEDIKLPHERDVCILSDIYRYPLLAFIPSRVWAVGRSGYDNQTNSRWQPIAVR